MDKVQMVTTTATYANKARDVLSKHGIASQVRKVQGGTAAGCLFGVVVSTADYDKAKTIMLENGIRIISERTVPS